MIKLLRSLVVNKKYLSEVGVVWLGGGGVFDGLKKII